MISPLKLSVIVCGAAVGLAVAPYVVKQILPPDAPEAVAPSQQSDAVAASSPVSLDLPVVAPQTNTVVAAAPVEPISSVIKEVAAPAAELHLSTPALPSPAPVAPTPAPMVVSAPELTLPSLAGTPAPVQVANAAMPSPSITPTPPAKPSPTPEIPYRSEVETAQKLMRELGLATGKIDGKLGPNTQAAIRDFQSKHKQPATGDVNLDLVAAMEKAVAAKTAAKEAAKKIEIADANSDKPAPADDPAALIVRKGAEEKTPEKDTKVAQASKPKVDPGPVPNLQNQPNVKKLQEQLKEAGTYTGPVDGRWGDLTRTAMREFQEKAGIEVTGKPNKETWLAMHSDVVKPVKSKETVTASAKPAPKKTSADELKISSADSTPDSASDDTELVVNVNGDGVSDPDLAEPIATPSAVSSLSSNKEAKSADAPEEAKVKVSVPARAISTGTESSANSEDKPSDLAVASDDDEVRVEKLRKEIEQRRTKIESVSNDSTYEVKKYAPKMLETVNNMVDDLKIESVSNNPSEARERLAKIDEELERAKKESMKKKATQTVGSVRESYDALKKSFPTRIKCLSLKDKDEKSKREELTELVAKIDLGFEAMQKDYNKGNYEPIFKNGRDFCATIDEINRTVADVYVSTKLEQKETKSKLDDKDLAEIKSLHKSEDQVKAADTLDGLLSSDSIKKKS